MYDSKHSEFSFIFKFVQSLFGMCLFKTLRTHNSKLHFRRKMRFATCLVLSWMISWMMTVILCPPVIQCFPLQLLQHCHHHLHHSTHLQTMKTFHLNPLIISLCDNPLCEGQLFVIDFVSTSAEQHYGPKLQRTDNLLWLANILKTRSHFLWDDLTLNGEYVGKIITWLWPNSNFKRCTLSLV